MRIALVSLDQIWGDKEANIGRCKEFVISAVEASCSIIIFPEMTLTGYSLEAQEICESTDDSITLRWFSDLARKSQINIVFGAVLSNQESSMPSNALCLAISDGQTRVIYKKIHPFSYVQENEHYMAGTELNLMKIDDIRMAPAICYDLRFPEIFSAMASGTHAFIVIANWPKKRIEHWYALLRARAIENQCFVVGVNRIGTDGNGIEYQKSSIIYSPQGDAVKSKSVGHEMDIYQLDIAEVAKYRDEFPTIKDKRYSLYRDLFGGF